MNSVVGARGVTVWSIQIALGSGAQPAPHDRGSVVARRRDGWWAGVIWLESQRGHVRAFWADRPGCFLMGASVAQRLIRGCRAALWESGYLFSAIRFAEYILSVIQQNIFAK